MNIEISDIGICVIEVTEYEIRLYNSDNNEIYFKTSDRYESWIDYDNHHRVVYVHDILGCYEWTTYTDDGHEVYFKDSSGYEKWTSYNFNEKHSYSKSTNGYECWSEYDEYHNLIHIKEIKL